NLSKAFVNQNADCSPHVIVNFLAVPLILCILSNLFYCSVLAVLTPNFKQTVHSNFHQTQICNIVHPKTHESKKEGMGVSPSPLINLYSRKASPLHLPAQRPCNLHSEQAEKPQETLSLVQRYFLPMVAQILLEGSWVPLRECSSI